MKRKFSKIFEFKNRAVSEIISTMLLVAITIVAGVTAFAIFNESALTQTTDSEFETGATSNRSVQLMGFDTRDGSRLGGIDLTGTDINNDFSDEILSGKSSTPDKILLRVRNPNFNDVIIDIVNVNEVLHEVDLDAAETTLTSSALPDAGKFRLFPPNSVTFSQPAIIPGGQDAIIIVTLHDTDLPNIELTESIRIIIGSPNFESIEFLIPAGSTS